MEVTITNVESLIKALSKCTSYQGCVGVNEEMFCDVLDALFVLHSKLAIDDVLSKLPKSTYKEIDPGFIKDGNAWMNVNDPTKSYKTATNEFNISTTPAVVHTDYSLSGEDAGVSAGCIISCKDCASKEHCHHYTEFHETEPSDSEWCKEMLKDETQYM